MLLLLPAVSWRFNCCWNLCDWEVVVLVDKSVVVVLAILLPCVFLQLADDLATVSASRKLAGTWRL